MARKMYYTEQEAAEILDVSVEELANYVRDDQLRVFQDGARKMFKSDEVHALASGGEDEEEIELSPGALEQAMAEQTSLGGELDLSPGALEQAMGEQTSLGGGLDEAGDQTELAPPIVSEAAGAEQTQMAPPTIVETTPSTEQTQMAPPTIVEEEVDLAPGPTESGLAERVELAPAEGDTSDAVTLVDITDQPVASAKEDTVITAEGISIFDEEDLEIEAADPLAKTQIAPSLEDQIAIDGVGSGSGLLDLTRESDDTSLGAEVLDHIDEMEGSVGSGMAAAAAVAADVAPVGGREVTYYVRDMPTELDASSGLFGGLAIGIAVVMVVLAGVVLSVLTRDVPTYLRAMRENIVYVLIGGVFVVGIAGTVGLLLGKSAAERRMMR